MGSLKFPVLNFISLRNLHVRVCKISISYYVCSICTVIYVYIFLREVLYIKSPNSCRSLTRPGILERKNERYLTRNETTADTAILFLSAVHVVHIDK